MNGIGSSACSTRTAAFLSQHTLVASLPARQDRHVDPQGNRTHKAREYLALPRLERVEYAVVVYHHGANVTSYNVDPIFVLGLFHGEERDGKANTIPSLNLFEQKRDLARKCNLKELVVPFACHSLHGVCRQVRVSSSHRLLCDDVSSREKVRLHSSLTASTRAHAHTCEHALVSPGCVWRGWHSSRLGCGTPFPYVPATPGTASPYTSGGLAPQYGTACRKSQHFLTRTLSVRFYA